MSDIQLVKDLYDRLWKGKFDQNLDLDQEDLYLLARIDSKDLQELAEYCCDYCFGALILLVYKKKDFYRFIEYIRAFSDEVIFKWLIDYEGSMEDSGNPLNTYVLDLEEIIDIIEIYYGSRYKLIYELCGYTECPSPADYMIRYVENGREKILDALKGKKYTTEQFDPRVLDKIWEMYHCECHD